MSGSEDLSHLLSHIQPQLHDGEFVITTVAHGRAIPHLALGSFSEDEATTIFLPRQVAVDLGMPVDSSWALITLSVQSSLNAVGVLARITNALAKLGISVNPISAFYHDHLFVPFEKRQEALQALVTLQSANNKSAIIIHGTLGSPHGNWFPWLSDQLSKRGYSVCAPQFPSPRGQSLDGWLETLEDLDVAINSDTILIGHSLGGTFILHLLERLAGPVHAAFLVSAPIAFIGIPEYDSLNQSFLNAEFDWEKIRHNAPILEIIHGEKDPYVPLAQALTLAKNLSVVLTVIPEAQHLNAEDGHLQFEFLNSRIKMLCD